MSSIEGSQPSQPEGSGRAAGDLASAERDSASALAAGASAAADADAAAAPWLRGRGAANDEATAPHGTTGLEVFSRFTSELHSASSADRVLQVLARAVCQMTGADEAVSTLTETPRHPKRRSALAHAHHDDRPPSISAPSQPTVFDAVAEGASSSMRWSQRDLETTSAWEKSDRDEGSEPLTTTSMLAAPLVGRGGEKVGFVHAIRRQAEGFSAEHERLLDQLAAQAVIAIENVTAATRLRQAEQRKDEFLATLAHEIRNPLTSIRTGLDLLASGENDDQLLEPMENQFEQLQRVVDDLMDVPRLVRGKIQLRRQPVSVGDVVQRAVDAVRAKIDEHGHTLSIRVPDAPVMLDADPVRIAQSLGNLLSNAAKYTDPGGQIWLDVRREADQVAFAVRDNGIGIEPELMPTVFELFHQAERTLDHAQGGLGIGLTLVKSLVEMHGGEVTVHSEGKDQGSEFILRLPVNDYSTIDGPTGGPAGREPAQQSRAEDDDPAPGLRVLVVDDNRSATRMLARLIGKLGNHVVSVAHDGASAIALAEEKSPDLVVLDIGLPEMSGHEVARRMRQLPQLSEALLVALTGYGDDKDRRESLESGFDLHLVKPIGIDDLQHLLEHPKLAQR